MNRLTKYFLIILSAVILIAGLCSCKDSQTDNSGNNSTNSNTSDNVVYSPYVEATLVLGDGANDDSIRILRNTYLRQTGNNIKTVSSETVQTEHEIIVGRTSREISQKAYRLLEIMSKESEEYVGYTIYSDGKSVAIAFDEAKYGVRAALIEAVEIFVAKYMTSPTLQCQSGMLEQCAFDSIDWQRKREEADVERLWELKAEQILSKVGNDETLSEYVLSELKNLYDLYNKDQKTVKWLANLYDPVTGGFYYSNSARNNEGYLPDLESTADAIGIVKSILVDYSGTLTDYFGEEISERFVSFVNGMQAEDNGYFYHPQWPKTAIDKNTNRRSRDLMSALNILSDFGAIPTYDTPNGVKGSSGRGGITATSALTLPLRKNNAVISVSSINNEDDIYIPSHLLTEDSFKSYLSTLNMSSSPLDCVKALSSQLVQIAFRDAQLEDAGENYRISELLINWLTSKQNKKTGLWGSDENLSSDSFKTLYEVATIYNSLCKKIPNSNLITDKITDFIISESDDSLNVNDLADAWAALSAVSENLGMFYLEDSDYKNNLERIYSKFDSLLENTRVKLVTLVLDDGSFKATKDAGNGKSYGMPVASSTADEGNVCATLTAIKNIWYAVFKTLNIGNVPVFMTSDRMMFQKTLLDMGVIVKNEIIESMPLDFEDDSVGAPLKDAKLTLSEATESVIVNGDKEHGNVLSIKSTNPASEDSIDIALLSSVGNATCNTVDLDMCVLAGTGDGDVLHMALYNYMYVLTINVKDGVVNLHEDSYKYTSRSYKHDLGARAKIGEWFNLRIEYYVGSRDTMRVKIFFNGECIAVTNNFYYKHDSLQSPRSSFSYLRFETVKTKDVNVWVDNVIAESNYNMYVPESNSNGKLVRNADAPDNGKTVYDFETATENSIPKGFVQTGGACGVISSNSNKMLSISKGVSKLKLPLSERGTLTNSAVVEFDAIVTADSEVGSYFVLSFNEYLLNGANMISFRFVVAEDALGKYLTFAEGNGSEEGTRYDNIRLPLGESINFRAHLFLDNKLALLMIDNTIVGVNKNVKSGFERCYMGEVAFSSSEKEATLLIDNLVCERIVSDYDAITLPSVDRELHDFNNLGGYASSGVNNYDGTVSFETSSINSYIKIPVNNRTGVATFGEVLVDVQRNEIAGEDLIISLADISGNKIISFALSASGDAVEIYEYTKNGKYPRVVYSVSASSFTIGIEYDIINADFNLLINGEYVFSTSVTYTPDSGKYKFEQLVISADGWSGFVIDNVVAETSLKSFDIPKYQSQNKDDTDELVTYEYSSFANLPTSLYNTGNFVTPEAKLSIAEMTVKGQVSRVLKYTSGTAAQDILLVNKWTKTLAGANAVAFQTDLMISAESKNLRFTLTLRASAVNACTIYIWSKDGKIMINSKNLKTADTYLDIKDGEWFNIRCEYAAPEYDYNYDGVNDVIVRVYVNGNLVADGIIPDKTSNIPSVSTVNQARLDIADGSSGEVYLDNTLYEQFNMKIDPPLPPDTDTLTFEPGVVGNSVKATTKKGSSLSVVDMTVKGEIGKVLKYVSASDVIDKLDVFVTQTKDRANAVSFETDIMISPISEVAEITIEPLNTNERQPFSLNLIAEKGGNVKLYANGIPQIVIGKSGEWIHLKIEYMNPNLDYDGNGDRDILVKIYVGESSVPTAIGYTPYSSTSHYDPVKLEMIRFGVKSNTQAEIYLDNTRFWQVSLTPDAGGKAPIVKDEEHFGNGGLDEDGWA